jgi:hypothetical protein
MTSLRKTAFSAPVETDLSNSALVARFVWGNAFAHVCFFSWPPACRTASLRSTCTEGDQALLAFFPHSFFPPTRSLQNGIFALEILPRSYLGALVVLTDGVVALHDDSTEAFDSILTLFSRYNFPLNFIQVRSRRHRVCPGKARAVVIHIMPTTSVHLFCHHSLLEDERRSIICKERIYSHIAYQQLAFSWFLIIPVWKGKVLNHVQSAHDPHVRCHQLPFRRSTRHCCLKRKGKSQSSVICSHMAAQAHVLHTYCTERFLRDAIHLMCLLVPHC